MILGLIFAAMTMVALGLLLAPLLRQRLRAPDRTAYDSRVYRDQLSEVERDRERGILSDEQAVAARTEVERRLLAVAAEGAAAEPPAANETARFATAAIIAIVLPIVASLIYLRAGSPDLPSQSLAQRADDRAQVAAESHEIEGMVARLAARLRQEPGDFDSWLILGRSYGFLRRNDEAAEAYRRALALRPDDPEAASAYGEALVAVAEGVVTPAARGAFETSFKADPGDPRSRFYLALAQEQSGEIRAAAESFAKLLRDAPADAPWAVAVRERIEIAAQKLGVDPATLMPAPRDAAMAGGFVPAPQGAEAVIAMSPERRAAFMRERIEALAARLKAEPGDIEGWLRLARSYAVLGESERARDAMAQADAASATGPVAARAAVRTTAEQLGLADTAPNKALALAPGVRPETAKTRAAAGPGGMLAQSAIERLNARLAAEPGDVDAWLKLGRAFGMLGEAAKARDAFARAAALRPQEVGVLAEYAEASVVAGGGDKVPAEAIAVFGRVLALDAANNDALWYLGVAAAQAGDLARASQYFDRLLAQVPTGSPEYSGIKARIAAIKNGK